MGWKAEHISNFRAGGSRGKNRTGKEAILISHAPPFPEATRIWILFVNIKCTYPNTSREL